MKKSPIELKKVIVRLGGFYALLSALGAVGYIYDGSGLKELFCTIYAPLSADNALAGKSYSREVRGHILVQCALAEIVMTKVTLSEQKKLYLDNFYANINKYNFKNFIADSRPTNIWE